MVAVPALKVQPLQIALAVAAQAPQASVAMPQARPLELPAPMVGPLAGQRQQGLQIQGLLVAVEGAVEVNQMPRRVLAEVLCAAVLVVVPVAVRAMQFMARAALAA